MRVALVRLGQVAEHDSGWASSGRKNDRAVDTSDS